MKILLVLVYTGVTLTMTAVVYANVVLMGAGVYVHHRPIKQVGMSHFITNSEVIASIEKE